MPPRLPSVWAQFPPAFLLPQSSAFLSIASRGIKSIHPPRPNRFNIGPDLPVLTSTSTAALARKANTLPLRTGALAIKKGMTAVYDPETGKRTPCTVVQLDRVEVVSHKTRQKNGYFAVQVGAGWKHPSNVTRPMLGHFAEHEVSPKRHLVEFRVKDESGLLAVGETIGADWFKPGQFVDTRANCKGKGFAGGMKRHGFSGQPASHGASLVHRAMGSAGQSQGGGSRVYPGKKMAGRMGGQQVTVQNVKVLSVDTDAGLVVLRGCISGPNGCVVKLQDAIKKPWPELIQTPLPSQSTEELSQTTA
ncbi:MAG: 54S ribosomal protein L9, mitochondrial [Geoglossum umbratile]|nr:MAG: 54S ribosomal protein L9, mitochondrial [Geoglossum umbratile]